jgi:hypothetical protein
VVLHQNIHGSLGVNIGTFEATILISSSFFQVFFPSSVFFLLLLFFLFSFQFQHVRGSESLKVCCTRLKIMEAEEKDPWPKDVHGLIEQL